MTFLVLIEYVGDQAAATANFVEHRQWLRGLLDEGRLHAAGVLAEGAGAVWVVDADSFGDACALAERDPFRAAGVSASFEVRPLHHWSAKAAVGAS